MANRFEGVPQYPCSGCPIVANCDLMRQAFAVVADKLPSDQRRLAGASLALTEAALHHVVQKQILLGPDQDGECCVDGPFQDRMDQLVEDPDSEHGIFAQRDLQG